MRTRSRPGLYLSDVGEGPPVLVITGWTISSAIVDDLAARCAGRARVIAYDHRGTGRSAPWPAPVSFAMLAADAARVLDDRGLRSAHVLGLSMGAAVALELAVRMPDRVRSMCLMGGASGGPTMTLPSPSVAARAAYALGRESVRHRRVWPAPMLFSDAFRRSAPAHADAMTRPFLEHRAPPWAVAWQTLAASCFNRRAALRGLDAPTLVVHGEHDVMVPLANARSLARTLPCAELHVFAGAGHAAPYEEPDRFIDLLSAWLARHDARRPPARSRAAVIREHTSRPFALHAGAARNAIDLARVVVSPRSADGGG